MVTIFWASEESKYNVPKGMCESGVGMW